jgi:ferric-dicitrate binding protein FerR (iron transport regulator)
MRVITLILFFISLATFADDVKIATIQGKVETDLGSGFQVAHEGDSLKEGQSIRTGADSLVILSYANGTKLKLNALTKITTHAQRGLDLIAGAVFAHVNKESHSHFYVKTPTAVAGVRGTEFFTAYGSGKQASDGWLCVNEGEVEVKPSEGTEPVLVKAGFGIVVEPGKKIEPPKKYDWTTHLNWNMDPSAGDVKDKTSMDSMYRNPLKHNYD